MSEDRKAQLTYEKVIVTNDKMCSTNTKGYIQQKVTAKGYTNQNRAPIENVHQSKHSPQLHNSQASITDINHRHQQSKTKKTNMNV